MASMVKIIGVRNVMRNLKVGNAKMGKAFEAGLKAGGLLLQRESQKIVPIDTGALKGTARTRKISGSGFETDMVVDYGSEADYSVYVHEDLNARHQKGKQAKYLEQPARLKRNEIIKEIRDTTRRKI